MLEPEQSQRPHPRLPFPGEQVETTHLSRSCKMCILSFCVALGFSSCALFEPSATGSSQVPHGHSWENHCCLTHVWDSVMSLMYAILLPSPYHILKNPCSFFSQDVFWCRTMAWPHFSVPKCHAFLFQHTPVRRQDKMSHLFMRAVSSSKGPNLYIRGKTLGPFYSLWYSCMPDTKQVGETQAARQKLHLATFLLLSYFCWSSPGEWLQSSNKLQES